MNQQLRQAAFLICNTILFCLIGASGWAQRFNAVVFDKLPQDYQLYPRNEQSEAQIPIVGRVEESDWQYLSVQVFRNKQAIGARRAAVTYTGNVGRFAIDPITIKAEKAEYDISVYLVKGADSVNVVNRTNIVSGDVYVLTGQSNASTFFRETRTNEFCRTFGKTSGTYGTEPGNPADTTWTLSNQALLTQDVGTLGFEFQQLILSTYGIPTCLINGAFHWSMMAHHATRTPGNPADLTNGYGRMLYRLQKGGIDKSVKALIYRQGESEAYGEGNNWGGYFDTYYKNLKLDLPSIKQLYVYQIDIIDPAVAAAPVVRETQRALVDKYTDIQVVPSVGTVGFDGLHYADEGYAQNAQELFRLIARDYYRSTDVDNIDAPNIRRAYYSSKDKSEITLQFAANQVLTWTDQYGNLLMKDFFYVDGQSGEVTAGGASGNRVVLTLKKPSTATKLTYLPPKVDIDSPNFPYRGPYITNKRDMRALSFYEFPIADFVERTPIATPLLTISSQLGATLQLNWNAVPTATGYVLEMKDPLTGTFREVKRLPAGTVMYLAEGLTGNTTYTYRLKAISADQESGWSEATGKTALLLATPVLQATATYATVVTLSWQAVTDAQGYVIERKSATDSGFMSVTSVGADVKSITDNQLTANVSYTYRVKATGLGAESSYATATVQTPALLAGPVLVIDVLYNNAVSVSWKAVPNATSYQLERKSADQNFQKIGTFTEAAQAFGDTNLLPGTQYSYRLKAFSLYSESPFVTTDVQTPALLPAPVISLTTVYNNAVNVKWTAVPNATAYQLERSTTGTDYFEVGTFKPVVVAYKDTNLTPGTVYIYRIVAVGNKTESPIVSASAVTPSLLATPDLLITPTSFDALTVSWKSSSTATHYLLERKTKGAGIYQNSVRINAPLSSYSDTQLAPNTLYQYRLTAYGDKTQSDGALAEATTLVLLAVNQDPIITLSLWPNPASAGQTSLRFSGPVTGIIQVLDMRGVVQFEQEVANVTQVPLSLSGYSIGTYLISVKKAGDRLVQKLLIN